MWLTKAHTSQEAPTSISGSSSHYRNTDNMTKAEAIQKYLNYAKKELSPYNVYVLLPKLL